MRISWGTPNSVRISLAERMVSQSDLLPMMIETSGGSERRTGSAPLLLALRECEALLAIEGAKRFEFHNGITGLGMHSCDRCSFTHVRRIDIISRGWRSRGRTHFRLPAKRTGGETAGVTWPAAVSVRRPVQCPGRVRAEYPGGCKSGVRSRVRPGA